MSNYYCLVAGLPNLSLEDGKLNYSIAQFKSELYTVLSDKDKRIIDLFYMQYDNKDLLRLLKNKDEKTGREGLFSAEELLLLIDAVRDDEIRDRKYPSYFYNFISQYWVLPVESLFSVEDLMASMYYEYAMACNNKFVSAWFEFNLNLNNVLAAFSARKYKLNVSDVIVGHTEICEQLRSSNARDFGLGDKLDYFESLLHIAETEDLVDREKKIDLLKWNWLENESFFHYFTIERVFVFLLQLEMIERWVSLDEEKGNELFRQMIEKLKNEVQIPEEFRK